MPITEWPDDEQGVIFRILQAHGFSFEGHHTVDYVVDFEVWPPLPKAIEALKNLYKNVTVNPPEEDGSAGCVEFQIRGPVTYQGVAEILRKTSEAMAPYGGKCDSWGVPLMPYH